MTSIIIPSRRFLIPVLFLLTICGVLFLAACSGGTAHTYKKAEDAQDAGREFIRASLDGDYEKATAYLYADTTNRMMLAKWKKDYDRLDHEVQKKYRDADILVLNVQALNDSVTSYTYANTYKKDTTTIRIVRIDGDWLVDLKEILNHK